MARIRSPSILLPLLAIFLLAPTLILAQTSSQSNYTLAPPFANLGDSASTTREQISYGAAANFALSALVILVVCLLVGWFSIAWFDGLAPRYGTRLKFNVVTGQPVLRDAPMRVLPSPEEARAQQQANGASAAYSGGNAPPSRFNACCPQGCDDRFWCPPCLLHCTCIEWLWCGPRCCCGQSSLSEWLFTLVYRNEAFRWFALFLQMCIMAMNLTALIIDQWSIDRNFPVPDGEWELRVGVIKMRTGTYYHTDYSCGSATGHDLIQCGTFRVAAGFVFALGLASCLLLSLAFLYSFYLLFSLRCASPRLWSLAAANWVCLTVLVLLWPLSAHLVIRHVYDSSLTLGPSFGIFIISWFLCTVWIMYLKGNVECTGLTESNDRSAQAEVKSLEERRTKAEEAQRSQVLILNPEHLELEAHRLQAAQWTKEGYGSSPSGAGGVRSPMEEYILRAHEAGFLRTDTVRQRPWHANDAIPAPEQVQPSWQEVEQAVWEYKQSLERARIEREARKLTHQKLEGPYSTAPPQYLSAAELDRRRAEAEAARSDPLLSGLEDAGLQRRDALRAAYGFVTPESQDYSDLVAGGRYTFHANASAPVRVIEDPMALEATFARADKTSAPTPQGMSTRNGATVTTAGSKERVAAANATLAAGGGGGAEEEDDDDDDVVTPLPKPELERFNILSKQYVQDSLQLDEAELGMLAEMGGAGRKKKQVKRSAVKPIEESSAEEGGREETKEQQGSDPTEPVDDASIQPALVSQPLTPAQYRAALAMDRLNAPNLLSPPRDTPQQEWMQGPPPFRLPPLPATLSSTRVFGSPRHVVPTFGMRSPLGSRHPFGNESSSPVNQQGRIYHYTADPMSFRPSYTNARSNPEPSMSRDLHFTGTFSGTQLGVTYSRPPQELNPVAGWQSPSHAATGQASPRFTINRPPNTAHLMVQTDSERDAFNRTIGTPQPVTIHPDQHLQQQQEDDGVDEDSYEREVPVRRIPLTPQTPRIIDGPQSASVLRTPQSQARMSYTQPFPGPYSNQFGY